MSWVKEYDIETILFYGAPKCGKTWAYLSLLRRVINNGGRAYIINTDKGISRTFTEYFGGNYRKYEKATDYYLVKNPKDIYRAVNKIKKSIQPKDMIIFDLVSDPWEFAQESFMTKLVDAMGGDIDAFFHQAATDPAKFGMFAEQKWQYIKKLHGVLMNLLVEAPCIIVGVATQKNLKVAQAKFDAALRRGSVKQKDKPDYMSVFEEIGFMPGGHKELSYKFNTIVYIQGKDKKEYIVVGDRGNPNTGKKRSFGKHFWKEFIENERSDKNENKS